MMTIIIIVVVGMLRKRRTAMAMVKMMINARIVNEGKTCDAFWVRLNAGWTHRKGSAPRATRAGVGLVMGQNR